MGQIQSQTLLQKPLWYMAYCSIPAARLIFLAAGGVVKGAECLPGNFQSTLISDMPVQNFMGDLLTQMYRFKPVYSAWPLLHISVVPLIMPFHPCFFQAANTHLQFSAKRKHFTLLLVITKIGFHGQNYSRISPPLSGKCYTEMVHDRWIYSPQV